MHRTITLISGLKVKIWSDNEDCTLSVFDNDLFFDAESTHIQLINYSEVSPKDRKTLAFYKK